MTYDRAKRRARLCLPYHLRTDIKPNGLDEIELALDLEEHYGWRARRDWGSMGGLHLCHPEWEGEVGPHQAKAIEDFAKFRNGDSYEN